MKFRSTDRTYVIAEIGINHNGDLDQAKKLIEAAVNAGVDSVKFQVRDLNSIYTKRVLKDPLRAEHGTQYLLNEIKKSLLTYDQIAELHRYCTTNFEVDFFATPFDGKSADFLNELGVELFKIGSPDFTNLPLIEKLTTFDKPIILSTGMASESEITQVISVLRQRNADFYLLHCNSTYPASIQDINLNYLQSLNKLTSGHFGYSGHEQGYAPSLAAVALGAKIIERHITFDTDFQGPDHRSSLTPSAFKEMISSIRDIEQALGVNRKVVNQGESNNKLSLSKSLVYASSLSAGHVLTIHDFLAKTPAKGVSPLQMDLFVGKALTHNVSEEDYVSLDDIKDIPADSMHLSFPQPWGIVGRLNDFEDFLELKPDLVEIHLTWRDLLEFDVNSILDKNPSYNQNLVVHAPEYFQDSLIDFTTSNKEITQLSREMLNRSVELARKLAPHFKGVNQNIGPRLVVHPGGHFKKISDYNKNEQYRLLKKNLRDIESEGVQILVENMPPYPWYFGGQWHNTVFLHPAEISQFAEEMNWGVCYDLSHALLFCNSAGIDIRSFTSKIKEHIRYLHISDGAGTTQEGLQLGEGNLDQEHLLEIMSQLDVGFIPEIWQGHLNRGDGFKKALHFLDKLIKKHAGKSCTIAGCKICSSEIPKHY